MLATALQIVAEQINETLLLVRQMLCTVKSKKLFE